MKIILGIDPGLRVTGYGVIQSNGRRHSYLASGSIATQGKDLCQRLAHIFSGVLEVMRLYQPQEAAIEQVFVHHNVASALKLGQARGAAIAALAHQNIQVAEYTPRFVKKTIVGNGAADKIQVQHMVKCLLNLSGTLQTDAADALAIAICHVQGRGLRM